MPDATTYTVDDPNTIVDGKTIAQWSQNWWTWAIQSPADHNAIDDKTGQFAHVANNQQVFFIGGTFGGDAARSFTVTAGKPLLVPMLNTFDTLDSKDFENQFIQKWPSTVTDVFASIDGNPVTDPTHYLQASDFFSMGTVRPHSVATEMFDGAVHNGQELTPTKATGYYLMVEGLSRGQHTLEFGGSTSDGFSTHVVDHITVV